MESTTDQLFTPLLIAAFNGKLDLCKCLVAAGANVEARNKQNYTPLAIAVQQGHTDIIGFLLDRYVRRELSEAPPHVLHLCGGLKRKAVTHILKRGGGCTHEMLVF